MIVVSYLPSSAADKLMTARGNRAWRCEVIVGLMSRTRCKTVIVTPEPGHPGTSSLRVGIQSAAHSRIGARRDPQFAAPAWKILRGNDCHCQTWIAAPAPSPVA